MPFFLKDSKHNLYNILSLPKSVGVFFITTSTSMKQCDRLNML